MNKKEKFNSILNPAKMLDFKYNCEIIILIKNKNMKKIKWKFYVHYKNSYFQ